MCSMLQQVGFSEILVHKAYLHEKQPDDSDALIVYECIK